MATIAIYLYSAAEVIKKHPNVMVVVNHCGLPYGSDDVDMKRWKEGEICC